MNMQRFKTLAIAASVSVGTLMAGNATANSVDAILNVGKAKAVAAQKSQKRIDTIAGETGDLLQDYKSVMKQIDGLKVYNERLQRQVTNQEERLGSLDGQVEEIAIIQRQVTPLAIRMIDGLEEFIKLDVPFHIKEREERIAFLRKNIDRSDITVAEKFRQVLEAYKIESEYGRKIDSYKGTVNVDGQDLDVNFLRVGRIALMYQSSDGALTGAWDKETREFVILPQGEYGNAVKKGLRIAKKQATIDIMKLPINAPEEK